MALKYMERQTFRQRVRVPDILFVLVLTLNCRNAFGDGGAVAAAVDPLATTRVVDAKLIRVLTGGKNNFPYRAEYQVTKIYSGSELDIGTIFGVRIEVGGGAGDGNAMIQAPEAGETGIWFLERDPNAGDWISSASCSRDTLQFTARRGVTTDFARYHTIADAIHEVWVAPPDKRLRLLDKMAHGSNGGVAATAVHLFAQVKTAGWKDTLRQWMNDPTNRVECQVALDWEMSLVFQDDWYRSKDRLPVLGRWAGAAVDHYDINAATLRVIGDSASLIGRIDSPPDLRERMVATYISFFVAAQKSDAFRKEGEGLSNLAQNIPHCVPDRKTGFKLLTSILVDDDNRALAIGCIRGITQVYRPLSAQEDEIIRTIRPKIRVKDVLLYIDAYLKPGQQL